MHNRSVFGFTLVEVLIAVGIVTILTALSFGAYTNYLQTSRDTDRKVDLETIRVALEEYKRDNGEYPSTPSQNTQLKNTLSQYLSGFPEDPRYTYGTNGYGYVYRKVNEGYQLFSKLEKGGYYVIDQYGANVLHTSSPPVPSSVQLFPTSTPAPDPALGCDPYAQFPLCSTGNDNGDSVMEYNGAQYDPKIRISYLSSNQSTIAYRICDFSYTDGSTSNCTAWTTEDISAKVSPGMGGPTTFNSYANSYVTLGGVKKIRESFILSDNSRSFMRLCNFDENAGVIDESTCDPTQTNTWNSRNLASEDTQPDTDILPYSHTTFFYTNQENVKQLRVSYLASTGQVQYWKTCNYLPDGREWGCGSFSALPINTVGPHGANPSIQFQGYGAILWLQDCRERIHQYFLEQGGNRLHILTCNWDRNGYPESGCPENPDNWIVVEDLATTEGLPVEVSNPIDIDVYLFDQLNANPVSYDVVIGDATCGGSGRWECNTGFQQCNCDCIVN